MLLALREMPAKLARPAFPAGKKRSLASRTSEGALSGDILKPMPFEPARLQKMGSLGRKMKYGL